MLRYAQHDSARGQKPIKNTIWVVFSIIHRILSLIDWIYNAKNCANDAEN